MKIKVSISGKINSAHSLNTLADILGHFTDALFALSLQEEISWPIIQYHKDKGEQIKIRIDKDD